MRYTTIKKKHAWISLGAIIFGVAAFYMVFFTNTLYAQEDVFTGRTHEHPSVRENNEAIRENNPAIWENYEGNPVNSKYGDRVIRNNDGEAIGYRVPKADGSANFYSYSTEELGSESERIGYESAPETDMEIEEYYDDFIDY